MLYHWLCYMLLCSGFPQYRPISMQCVLRSKQRKATRKIHPKAARTRMGNTLHDNFPGIALTGKELVMPSPRWQPSLALFACPASTQTGCSMVPAGTADSRRGTCWLWTSAEGVTGETMRFQGPEGWRHTVPNGMQSQSSTFWADDGALFM